MLGVCSRAEDRSPAVAFFGAAFFAPDFFVVRLAAAFLDLATFGSGGGGGMALDARCPVPDSATGLVGSVLGVALVA